MCTVIIFCVWGLKGLNHVVHVSQVDSQFLMYKIILLFYFKLQCIFTCA